MAQAHGEMFPNQRLRRLLIPLLAEQFLAIAIGVVATYMVSGDTPAELAAVSAVSLVENINMLLTQVFAALATGGAVVAAQYLGRGEQKRACDAAKQLMLAVIAVSTALSALAIGLARPILRAIFGGIDETTMAAAITYFTVSALSYPALAMYNAGAALFRAMNNSKTPMWLSLAMNVVNVALCTVTIRLWHMSVAGAALSALVARVVGGACALKLLLRPGQPLYIDQPLKIRWQGDMIKRILRIGLPNGLEGGIFQIGKIVVMQLIASFGLAATAANGIANTLSSVANVPGSAVTLAMLTVVGQCMGAGEVEQAARYTRRLMLYILLMMVIGNGAMLLGLSPLLTAAGLSGEAYRMARDVMVLFLLTAIPFWPPAFAMPAALRASGDVLFVFAVSALSMWIFRIGFSYLLCLRYGMGLFGVWLSMILDWVARGIAYEIRFLRGAWREKRVL
ncbi:MAG: MATE family efflux transporter [Clostridiales bacterium]|nr:MATE family efflux transporter [Clostridiales bacterium]